jgi:hypothetical protein
MAEVLSDYDTKIAKQLRALLKRRKIPAKRLSPKAQLITALEDDDEIKERKSESEHLQHPKMPVRVGPRMRMEDYSALTYVALDRLVAQSYLAVQPRTRARLTDALETNDRIRRRTPLQVLLERRRKRERGSRLMGRCASQTVLWTLLFQSDFRADMTKKSFLCLPRELRDMVYHHVFNISDITGASSQMGKSSLDIDYDAVTNRFWPIEPISNPSDFRRTIDALLVLGTLNKTVWKEIRAVFWSMAHFRLRVDGVYARSQARYKAAHMFAVTARFLSSIADEGRFGLKSLVVSEWGNMDVVTATGYLAFTKTMRLLADCVSLTKLRLAMDVKLIFREDKAGLQDLLLRGKPMESKGLQILTRTLLTTGRLRSVEILPYQQNCVWKMPQEQDMFLRWAFTDVRRLWLWLVVREELQPPGKVVVSIPDELPEGITQSVW